MTDDISTKIDREIEFYVNNLRAGVEDLLGVKKQTAKRILGILASGTDVYLDSSSLNISTAVLVHIIHLYLVPLIYGEKGSSQSNGGTKSAEHFDNIDIYIRLLNIYIFLFLAVYGNFYSVPFILYLAQNIHDDDDQGIKDWAQGKLKELKQSIKIPGVKPSPA